MVQTSDQGALAHGTVYEGRAKRDVEAPSEGSCLMQLSLRLGVKEAPWGGKSPRTLTKAFRIFSLAADGTPPPIETPTAVQLELFPEGTPFGR